MICGYVLAFTITHWAPWAATHLSEYDDAERNRRVAGMACMVRAACSGGPHPDICYAQTTTRKRVELGPDDPRDEAHPKQKH